MLVSSRSSPSDGVRSEPRFGCERWEHTARGACSVSAGHAQTDHALLRRLSSVVSASTEVSGVENGDCASTVLFGLVDGDLHHLAADVDA